MEKIKALYLNVREEKFPEVIELNAEGSNLETFYKLLDCNTIDIVKRSFCNGQYYIVCDDEALIREDRKPALSYASSDFYCNVYGNIIICKPSDHDDRDFDSLTKSDLFKLSMSTRVLVTEQGCRVVFIG